MGDYSIITYLNIFVYEQHCSKWVLMRTKVKTNNIQEIQTYIKPVKKHNIPLLETSEIT